MLVDAKDLGEGVRMLILNRPPANAIVPELLDALYEQAKAAREDSDVRAVIVTGAGKFFSGGLDLKDPSSAKVNPAGSETDGMFALWTLPKPTVAMVNGHAIAGGTVIAATCDFAVTCRGKHKFGLNELVLGFPMRVGPYEIMRHKLTKKQLRAALFGAEICGPERALELGFVDEVTEPDQLESRCVELARKLAKNAQLAYGFTKRLMRREAVARVLSPPPELPREAAAVRQSEETRALLAAHLSGMSRR